MSLEENLNEEQKALIRVLKILALPSKDFYKYYINNYSISKKRFSEKELNNKNNFEYGIPFLNEIYYKRLDFWDGDLRHMPTNYKSIYAEIIRNKPFQPFLWTKLKDENIKILEIFTKNILEYWYEYIS